jgi:hypothetical protein
MKPQPKYESVITLIVRDHNDVWIDVGSEDAANWLETELGDMAVINARPGDSVRYSPMHNSDVVQTFTWTKYQLEISKRYDFDEALRWICDHIGAPFPQ